MSKYSISEDTAALIEQVHQAHNTMTIDTESSGILISIWSQTHPDGSSSELAKHRSTTMEAAVKGAFKKWKKRK